MSPSTSDSPTGESLSSEWETSSATIWVSSLLTVWLVLFTIGITVDSEPYRENVSPSGAAAIGDSTEADTVKIVPEWLEREQDSLLTADSLHIIQFSSDTAAAPETLRIGSSSLGGAEEGDQSESKGGCWALLSAAGSFLGSFFGVLGSFLMVLISFTPTNLALICCTAGVIGAAGRRLQLSTDPDRDNRDRSHPLLSAFVRGLFVFLIAISGILVLLEDPILGTASPGQYIRFAGLLSLTSFIVNYDPTVFVLLVDQVRERIQERSEGESSGKEEKGEAEAESSGGEST